MVISLLPTDLWFAAGGSLLFSGHAVLGGVRICCPIQQGCDMVGQSKYMLHCCSTLESLTRHT